LIFGNVEDWEIFFFTQVNIDRTTRIRAVEIFVHHANNQSSTTWRHSIGKQVDCSLFYLLALVVRWDQNTGKRATKTPCTV